MANKIVTGGEERKWAIVFVMLILWGATLHMGQWLLSNTHCLINGPKHYDFDWSDGPFNFLILLHLFFKFCFYFLVGFSSSLIVNTGLETFLVSKGLCQTCQI